MIRDDELYYVDGYFGVWRTVGGKRIFIRQGEELSAAMIRSGKFVSEKENIASKNMKFKLNNQLFASKKDDIDNIDYSEFKTNIPPNIRKIAEKEAFNHSTDEQRKKGIYTKCINNYIYLIKYDNEEGTNHRYIILGRKRIKNILEKEEYGEL